MNINTPLQLFTYTVDNSVAIKDLSSIANISKVIGIDENGGFQFYIDGLPDFLQGLTSLENNEGYAIISKPAASFPYELYASTDNIPESVTIAKLAQIATYCGTGFNLVGITITSQPSNDELSGDTASFSVEATVVGGVSLTYQWQISTDDGANWNDISGETNATLNLTGLSSNDVGNQYRVIVGATGEDSVTSNAVSLTAPAVTLSITQHPQNTTAVDGEASFDVAATVSDGSALTYQWENETLAGDDITFTQRTLPVSANWYQVTYGNGVFVAIVYGSNIAATSTDGITWTQRTLPAWENWSSIAHGNGVFVAVTYGSNIAATSTDGINWTQRTLPASENWSSIAHGNGVFVAVAVNSNVAITSTDGINWTQRTLPASGYWFSVAYGNGVFVAIASSGGIAATSTDGATWTQRTLPVLGYWYRVTYGNGVFVAIATSGGIAATSTDGATWTQRTLPDTATWYGVAYGDGVFVAIGTGSNIAATSPDGITWTQRTLPATADWYAVTYGNGTFVAVAVNSNIAATGIVGTLQFLPISGETSSTLNLTGLTIADDGNRYRVVVDSPSVEPVTSDIATLTVLSDFAITTHPQNQTSDVNAQASFSGLAEETVYGATPTYQWQVSTDGGNNWVDISGQTSPTLTLSSLTVANDGDQYRFVATAITIVGTLILESDAATLSIPQPNLSISTQPVDTTSDVNFEASFSVVASESAYGTTLDYQWQLSQDSGATWSNIASETSPTLALTGLTPSDDGNSYRVVITAVTPVETVTLNSDAATLSILQPNLAISTQPQNQTSDVNAQASFSVVASESAYSTTLDYQWQLSQDSGATWSDIASETSPSLTFTGLTTSDDGNSYRVVVTAVTPVETVTLNSDAATLSILQPNLEISTHPQHVSASQGDASFSVVASESAYSTTLDYQWQLSQDSGATWSDIASETSPSLTFTGLTTSDDGNSYRVVVTAVTPVGTVTEYSDVATLSVPVELEITLQPQNTTASGDEASFAVAAAINDGSALTYQWEEERLPVAGEVWKQRTLPQSTGWTSVTYGNGTFVAVAYGNYIAATSTDGITWTQHPTLPAFGSWSSVTYGDGTFVAVLMNTNIAATSTDGGQTWTQRTLPVTVFWESVTYGNGTFVAVAGNTAATSTDGGQTWTQRTLPAAGYSSVTYGDGTFVAVALNTNIAATSTDGITWTQRTMPATAYWRSVTYGNGTFVAVGVSPSNFNVQIAATSADGITWTQRTMPATTAYWRSVTYGNGTFVAVAGGTNIAATSPDGITWTQRTLPATESWYSVTYGNGTFVAVVEASNIAATSDSTLQFVPISGETSSTLNLTDLTTADDGGRYRVVVDSPSVEPVISDAATLSVPQPNLAISTQPQNQTSDVNAQASFSVVASESVYSTTPTYQWQLSQDSGATWSDIANETSSTLTLAGLTTSDEGNNYRVVITAATPVETVTLNSDAATLSILPSNLYFQINPTDSTSDSSGNVTFSALAIEDVYNSPPTYQWQKSTDSGQNWSDIQNENSETLTLSVSSSDNLNQYRVIATTVTPVETVSLTSSHAILEVPAGGIIFDTQPANTISDINRTASFTVLAHEEDYGQTVNYEWQESSDGVSWITLSETSTTLNLTNLTLAKNNYQYRVVATSDTGVIGEVTRNSNVATLSILQPNLVISTQPVDTTSDVNAEASFSVVASESVYSTTPDYQWQLSQDSGATWSDIASETSPTLALTGLTTSDDGNSYRVVVTAVTPVGTVTVNSNAATLSILQPNLVISTHPQHVSASQGDASFSVVASESVYGTTPDYQWQLSQDSGATWSDIANETSATLALTGLTILDDGNSYRVVVTAVTPVGTVTVNSNVATLSILQPNLVISTHPQHVSASQGDASFSVVASESAYSTTLDYQWQLSQDSGATWSDIANETSSTLALTGLRTSDDGNSYRVVITAVTPVGTVTEYSDVATLAVPATWIQVGADIDGEAAGDFSGASVAMSSDGSRVAIGAYYNSGAATEAGHVRVYDLVGSTWTQVGADIDGEAAGDWSGFSVAMSSDGSRVAIGARWNDGLGAGTNTGHVRVYDLVGSTWAQVGADIDGEAVGDQSGWSIAMSSDGSRVAIGSYRNDDAGTDAGHVRVYDLIGSTWTQVGADIDGEAAYDESGYSVAMSSDGSRVAIGAIGFSDTGGNAGHVRVYDLVGSTWMQVGSDIAGEADRDYSGVSVAMSSDGSRIAIGADGNGGAGTDAGHVRVYDLVGSTWTQVGADIDGEAMNDHSGFSVAMSSDGSRVAIGAYGNDDAGLTAGHVRVYDLIGSTWTQVGADIDGEAAGDASGRSVAMSSDGSRIAIGAYVNDDAGTSAGHVRVFDV